MSSFYSYSNGDFTAEEQLRKHHYHFVHSPQLYGFGNTYTLLGKLDNEKINSINVDDVYIYKSNHVISYKNTQPDYGSIIVNFIKYDLGRVSLVYYYPLDEYKKVLKEVKNTWGTIRFKKDSEFIPPKHNSKQELYFGKFSHLNNPNQ